MTNLNQVKDHEIWHPYWNWECYLHGMYDARKPKEQVIANCINLLSDPTKCRAAMSLVISVFRISTEHHLTKQTGKKSWLGQAACCLSLSATEEETRCAWGFMNEDSRKSANAIADDIILGWREPCN